MISYVADDSILAVVDSISINATANSGQRADADSATIGLVALGGNLVRAESNVTTSAYVGKGVQIGSGDPIGGLQDGQTYYLVLDDTRAFTPALDIADDEVKLGAGLVTGDQIIYQEGSLKNPAIAGLTDGEVYTVKVNANDPNWVRLVDLNGKEVKILDASGAVGFLDMLSISLISVKNAEFRRQRLTSWVTKSSSVPGWLPGTGFFSSRALSPTLASWA